MSPRVRCRRCNAVTLLSQWISVGKGNLLLRSGGTNIGSLTITWRWARNFTSFSSRETCTRFRNRRASSADGGVSHRHFLHRLARLNIANLQVANRASRRLTNSVAKRGLVQSSFCDRRYYRWLGIVGERIRFASVIVGSGDDLSTGCTTAAATSFAVTTARGTTF
jgi:hypothetical protein